MPAKSAYSRTVPLTLSKQIYCCLLAGLLAVLRIADAHAHFCFDGKEPPVSLVFAGNGANLSGTGESREPLCDTDVQFAADAVLKKPTVDDSWVVGLATCDFFRFISFGSEQPITRMGESVPAEQRANLRPPLRGPPV